MNVRRARDSPKFPVAQVKLTVMDGAGVPAPAGTAGEIRVREPSVAAVYRTAAAGTVPVTDGVGDSGTPPSKNDSLTK